MPAVQSKDYYEILGVTKSADAKAIQAAFRKLARKHHPDVNPGDKAAEERFKDLNEAQEVLSDPASRKLYDRYGGDWQRYRDAGFNGSEPAGPAARPGGGARTTGGAQNADFERWFSSAEDGGRTTYRGGDSGGGFSEFVSSMFGSTRRPSGGATQKRRGEDLSVDVKISFEEAFSGATRRLDIEAPEPCPTCQGSGFVRQAPCPTCDGTGVVSKNKTVEVKIPAGVDTGQKIRIRGQGGPGFAGGARGDILLNVAVEPSDLFDRDGANLKTEIEVPLYTAVLGGEVVVPTPRGRVALAIPPESQNGRQFRLKGQGMPGSKGVKGDAGDLLARIRIVIPLEIGEKERELFRELQRLRTETRTPPA